MEKYYSIAEFDEDEIIIKEGEVSDSLYYIESGNATSYVGYESGNGYLVELLGKGRFCGETGFLTGGKNTVTVVANVPLKARVVHKDHFKQYISEFPNTGIELMHHMAKDKSALTKHIGIISDELYSLIDSIESGKPVPIDLKRKLLQYKMWK